MELMNDLQVLQNKAAKIILDRPLYSSASDALVALKWLNLEQRRFNHRCIYVYKCINGLFKQLFFEIEVNSGRIFTEPRSSKIIKVLYI